MSSSDTDTAPSGRSGAGRLLLRAAVTVGLLYFIFSRIDFSGVELRSLEYVVAGVAVAVLLLLINQAVSALRWKLILGRDALPLGYLVRLNLIGIFFSTFLPTSVGGDAIRAWAVAKEVPEPGVGLSSVVLDRGMGFGALVGYLGVGAFLAHEMILDLLAQLEWSLPGWMWGLAGLLTVPAVWLAIRSTRLGRWIRQSLRHLNRFRRSVGDVTGAVALSFLVQGGYIAVWMVLAVAVGFELPAETFLVTVPVVSLGAMIPVTLSGVGIREGLWILLLSRYELGAATVATFSILYFVAFALTGAIGGIVYVWRGVAREPAARGAA